MSAAKTATGPPPTLHKLGWFLGVFTPTILTILGVIMFLRLGWVVGVAGLWRTLAIVLLANAITLATALSMSSLATNMKVGVGGAYYIISRSLGLEAGGAIGIPLYLSQTLSITLYAYGLAESVTLIWPDAPIQVLAILIILGVTLVAAKSTELTLKAQLPIMGLIALAIASLFFGVEWGVAKASMGAAEAGIYPGFWVVFAVFFPAVTGVLAGVSLSGDLEDPGVAIPKGAIIATLVGFVVYMITPFALYYAADAPTLRADSLIWTSVAAVGWLVVPGLMGAILSSAFGSILGAPRTLQALANDGLAPKSLGRADDKTGEPLFGLRVSGGIALVVAVFLPDLNAVALWVTIFFLTTYGALNAVAAMETLVGDPSFRPRIRVPWWVSGMGALGCLVAMLAIHPVACLVAIFVELVIFWAISRRSLEATWGDVRNGLWFQMARFSLMQLRDARLDPRNWRPHILVFTKNAKHDLPMVELAVLLGQGRSILTTMTLLKGDIEDHKHADELLRSTKRHLDAAKLLVFSEVAAVPDLDAGMVTVAQANGFAGMQSNTCLFGWPGDRADRLARLLTIVRKMEGLNKCSLIYRHAIQRGEGAQRSIVVWWKGMESNGDLMLLLAHLLTGAPGWRNARVVLKSVVRDEDERRGRQLEFGSLLPEARIDAQFEVLLAPEGETAASMIRHHSREADLVMLGLGVARSGDEQVYAERLLNLVEGLPSTLLVRNAGPFTGKLV